MKVLVTGAFGNIGRGTVDELLSRGHQVRCFDLQSSANAKAARRLPREVEICWGDLRSPQDLETAVAGADLVIHLAFVIPKLSVTGIGCEDQPDWAWEINVEGTRNLLSAMKEAGVARLIFASSLHIYGITRDQPPPRRITDPPKPVGYYARHKVACERLVRDSGLVWSVFRFAAALPFSLQLDGAMFEIPLENRIEYVHHRDVALALAKAVECPEIWGKTLHIGGGPRCQYTYGEMVRRIMNAVGIGMLPEEAFSRKPFSTDWIDTEESQKLLDYQRLSLDDYAGELARRLGPRRIAAVVFRPLARALLLRRSPYYAVRRLDRQRQALLRKLVLVTCASNSFGEAVARKLAQEGMRVVLVARPREDLSVLAYEIRQEGGEVEVAEGDLSTSQGALELFGRLRERFGPPDVLVNYADLVWLDGKADEPDQDWISNWTRIEENLLGTIRFSELVLEEMKKNGAGQLVYLEPALKLFPVRPVALLHALRSLFRIFWHETARELRHTSLRVSLVKVGISTTELFWIRRLLAVVRSRPFRRNRYGVELRPEDLANRIWTLLIQPQSVVYVPRVMAVFSWLDSYAGWLITLIREHLLPRPAKARS
jgi:UDP-glucose 4-epimerase